MPTATQPIPTAPAPRPPRRRRLSLATLFAGAVLGAGGAYALVQLQDDSSPVKSAGTTASAPASSASSTPAPQSPPTSVSTSTTSRTVAQIYKDESKGVVQIVATSPASSGFGSGSQSAEGTGFVIDEQGDVLTNEHVVDGATTIRVSFSDGRNVQARLLGSDASRDLAMLKVDVPASELDPLPLGSSSNVSPGDPVIAIGNPFGYVRSVSTGIVSGLGREIQAPNGFTITGAIQTDAAINHGNSGGPLLDASGRVIGITAQIADSGVNANVGVGFAVPIDAATSELAALRNGTVSHAWLGISGGTLTPAIASAAHLSQTSGVIISGITPDSPASHAGLQGGTGSANVNGEAVCVGGDVITSIDGQAVSSMTRLMDIMATKKADATVTLGVARGGGSRVDKIKVTLAAQPSSGAPQQQTSSCPG
jgi:S1-C subfamily serine protease